MWRLINTELIEAGDKDYSDRFFVGLQHRGGAIGGGTLHEETLKPRRSTARLCKAFRIFPEL
jgi:hypothetical protein